MAHLSVSRALSRGTDARFRPAAFGQLPIGTNPVPRELAGKMIQRIEEPSGGMEGGGSGHWHGQRLTSAPGHRRGARGGDPAQSDAPADCGASVRDDAGGRQNLDLAALSLSRLWQGQHRWEAAYHVLAEIFGWFTEGFDTADLQEAKALLVGLS